MTTIPTEGKKWGALDLYVLSLEEYHKLPDGAALVCIDGSVAIKGTDSVNLDTRYGCIAYGFLKPKD